MKELANAFGYSAPVWRHFVLARAAGRFAADVPGVIAAEAGSPAAKSLLRMELRLRGDRIAQARFQAYGCPVGIAVGAWLAQWLPGKTAGQLAGLHAADIRAALEITEDKAHCAFMGEDVVQALMKQIQDRT